MVKEGIYSSHAACDVTDYFGLRLTCHFSRWQVKSRIECNIRQAFLASFLMTRQNSVNIQPATDSIEQEIFSAFVTIVSYQIQSFSSKWELPSLLSTSFITLGGMEAIKAALILTKNSHFDSTSQDRKKTLGLILNERAKTSVDIEKSHFYFWL